MKKLKIGLFMDNYFPIYEGVTMTMHNYAMNFSKCADVTVVVPNIDKKKQDDSIYPYRIIRVKSVNFNKIGYHVGTPVFDKKTVKEIEKIDFDIIHIHSPFMMGRLGIKIGKKKHIPVIATMHTQFKQDFLRYTKSETISNTLLKGIMKNFNSCYECWAVNDDVAKVFMEYGAKEYPKVMNNATDLILTPNYQKSCDHVNKTYNIKKDELVFLFVGRINIVKNILFIVDALKILKDKGIKYTMLFVGPLFDEKPLKERIEMHHLEDDIIITDKVTDRELLRNIYARAKLFLFPSLYDASSLVQIEAASQKTPSIFLEGAATAQTITNNVNGFIAKNNLNDFTNRIIEILNDDKLYEKVSNNTYRDLYKSWEDVAGIAYNKYLKIIDDYHKENNTDK